MLFGFLGAWLVLFVTPFGGVALDGVIRLAALVALGLVFAWLLARLAARVADQPRPRP